MQIKFGALMDVNSMACYKNPATGKVDKMSQRMAYATLRFFNDSLTRFVLENTRDEVMITPERSHYRSKSGKGVIEAMNFKIQLQGIPGYNDHLGMTYGFNPFRQVDQKGKLQGILTAKARILNSIIERHQFAEQLLKDTTPDQYIP